MVREAEVSWRAHLELVRSALGERFDAWMVRLAEGTAYCMGYGSPPTETLEQFEWRMGWPLGPEQEFP
jgi:hypothetical protein